MMAEISDQQPNLSQSPREKFEEALPIGDMGFFVNTWPAWLIDPDQHHYSPVSRLAIGDSNGNIILRREVVFTGILDLLDEITSSMNVEVDMMKNFKEYNLFLPLSKDELKTSFNVIINRLKFMLESFDSIDVISINDVSDEKTSESA